MTEDEKKMIVDNVPACVEDFINSNNSVAGFEVQTNSGNVSVVIANQFYKNLFLKIAEAVKDNDKLNKIRELIDF